MLDLNNIVLLLSKENKLYLINIITNLIHTL